MYIDYEATNPQFYKIKENKKVEQKITFGSNPCLSFNSFFNFSINSSIESYVNKIDREHHKILRRPSKHHLLQIL